MRKSKNDYGRYTKFTLPDIEACTFGDLKSVYGDKDGNPFEVELEKCWRELEDFLKNEVAKACRNDDEDIIPLKEILHWTEKRDAYSVALLIEISWEKVEKVLAGSRYSDRIIEFMQQLRLSIK